MELKKKVLTSLGTMAIALIIFLILAAPFGNEETSDSKELVRDKEESNFDSSKIKKTSEGTKYIINPDKLVDGGPPKGGIGKNRGIPALEEGQVKFVSPEEADEWIENDELVLAINYKGEKRAYPLQILVFHEIINERIKGDPLLITYCPLCGTGIAYERKISVDGKEKVPEFGTSGKLYNSNLVMYDDITDTYWQQIDGKAIVGKLTGQELKAEPIETVSWQEWNSNNDNFKVLSKKTGFNKPYGQNPYGGYRENDRTFFDYNNEDNIIEPKSVVFGIELNGKYKAYREADLDKGEKIEDEFANTMIEITKDEDGSVRFVNKETGERIVKERGFWFSWHAFHPETELYNYEI